jgi:hypothetical protein
MAWTEPDVPVQLKKRILRTVLNEIIVQSERESRTHLVILHWAGGVHTKLSVECNPSGQHRRRAERTVIGLVSELAKVCPDKAIAAILNRLGYKTGQEKSWNVSRVAGLRGYHNIEPFQKQDGWVNTGASGGTSHREQYSYQTSHPRTVTRGAWKRPPMAAAACGAARDMISTRFSTSAASAASPGWKRYRTLSGPVCRPKRGRVRRRRKSSNAGKKTMNNFGKGSSGYARTRQGRRS